MTVSRSLGASWWGAALVLLAAALPARAQTFDPARHLPPDPLVVLDCAGLDAWGEALDASWTGQLLGHPRMQAASVELRASLRRMALQYGAVLWLALGWQPDEVFEQLGGRVVVALYDVTPDGPPTLVLALEGRDQGDSLYAGLVNVLRERLPLEPVDGVPGALRADLGPSALHVVRLGGATVFTLGEVFAPLVALHRADDGQGALGDSAFGRQLEAELGHERPGLLLAVDGRACMAKVRASARGPRDAAEVEERLGVTGLGRLGLAGLSLGFGAEGQLEERLVLELRGDAPPGGDLAGTLLEALATPVGGADLDAALALLPADAISVGAARFDLAGAAARAETWALAHVPDARENLADFWGRLHGKLGLARETLLALPALTVVSASTEPAAGGLLPDTVSLVRDAELDPWWQLLEHGLTRIDVRFHDVDLGDDVQLRTVDWIGAVNGPTLQERMVANEMGGVREHEDDGGARMMMLLAGPLSLPVSHLARTDAGDGWSAVATSSQAAERFARGRDGARLRDDDLGRTARGLMPGRMASFVLRGESWAPAVWNTLLSISAPFQSSLGLVGLDGTLLPPAELLPAPRPSLDWMTVDVSESRLAVRASGGAATPVLLAVGAGAGAAALMGLRSEQAFSAARMARERAEPVPTPAEVDLTWDEAVDQHVEKMQALHAKLTAYAQRRDSLFPHGGPGSSTNAFQQLVDAAPPGAFSPGDFVSPIGWEYETSTDDEGRPQLDYYSCSWRMVPWRVATGGSGPLFFDSKPYADEGKRYVCFIDGTIALMGETEFQEMLSAERAARAARQGR